MAGESSVYQSETYKGVEIRVRCSVNGRSGFWVGSYAFFTGALTPRRNVRVQGSTAEPTSSEGDAARSAFAAGREAVDLYIQTTVMTKTTP